MLRNADPKHGRWILPLIIVAMIVLTYTFVVSLEPAEESIEATDTTVVPPFPTEPTTSTTLPADIQAFLVTLDVFETQVLAYDDEITTINDDWENRDVTGVDFNETLDALQQVEASISAWEDEVAEAADPTTAPPGMGEPLVQLLLDVEELAPGVEDIILGLRAPDDGTLRREAVAEYNNKTEAVVATLDEIRDLAGEQEQGGSTTTEPDGATTSGGGTDA